MSWTQGEQQTGCGYLSGSGITVAGKKVGRGPDSGGIIGLLVFLP